ncbi:hypothetical protein Lal_00031161 [Lupinus albus]|nr:hypothetical protein Lal_00031161 [Lupinus albus]
MVVIMTEILGDYTEVLRRVADRLLRRRGLSFDSLRNFGSASTTSSLDSTSFMVMYLCRKVKHIKAIMQSGGSEENKTP